MKPKLLGAVLLIATGVAVPAAAQETPADAPLLRMRDGRGSDLLFRLNPRTLQQLGRPIRTFRSGSDLRLSPDGSRLAFADPARRSTRREARRDARIHFVDTASWRSMGVARIGRLGWLTIGWAGPERVVA